MDMGLMRQSDGFTYLKLNCRFYDIDGIISILTRYKNDYENSFSLDFSNQPGNRYIKVMLKPKNKKSMPVQTLINELLK